ncbi:hypothetical protein [Nonomuraea soli]|uniref:Uncharacterized protein n=1 Tax=Nonomuraea soli TaxID=1032476 RepID=A0A7W0CJV4_9ACTN|nr:hypothetical protein [Nonomuraea soli]MBA2892506.1 hypothetical protein [Nonomuraea soli]
MRWRWVVAAGLALIVAGAVMGVLAWNERPPAPAAGLTRLTLPRASGLPPLDHRYPGGTVSLNAVLGDDEVFLGISGTHQETTVRKGQTIEIPGGTLTLVEIWNVWQRAHDAVDVKITSG